MKFSTVARIGVCVCSRGESSAETTLVYSLRSQKTLCSFDPEHQVHVRYPSLLILNRVGVSGVRAKDILVLQLLCHLL